MSELLSSLLQFLQPVWELLIYSVGLLDALPGYIRAMLTALLLVLLLAKVEREIKAKETRFAELFRKSAFFALATIPSIVLLFPSTRLVVYTDVLPSIGSQAHALWLGLAGLWCLGFAIALMRLLQSHVAARAQQGSMTVLPKEAKLTARLAHWRRNLGTAREVE